MPLRKRRRFAAAAWIHIENRPAIFFAAPFASGLYSFAQYFVCVSNCSSTGNVQYCVKPLQHREDIDLESLPTRSFLPVVPSVDIENVPRDLTATPIVPTNPSMSFQARQARAVMAVPTHLEHLEVRQASPSGSSGIASATQKQSSSAFKAPPQPTSMIALTTTFTPPKTCFENRLSMLAPRFEVWANPPVPAADVTSSECYPSEFLGAYTAVEIPVTVSSTTASSVVPAMSGFVCPANFCTQISRDNNYVACCPS